MHRRFEHTSTLRLMTAHANRHPAGKRNLAPEIARTDWTSAEFRQLLRRVFFIAWQAAKMTRDRHDLGGLNIKPLVAEFMPNTALTADESVMQAV